MFEKTSGLLMFCSWQYVDAHLSSFRTVEFEFRKALQLQALYLWLSPARLRIAILFHSIPAVLDVALPASVGDRAVL